MLSSVTEFYASARDNDAKGNYSGLLRATSHHRCDLDISTLIFLFCIAGCYSRARVAITRNASVARHTGVENAKSLETLSFHVQKLCDGVRSGPPGISKMLTFSLIVATVGRTKELETLFESLVSQAYPEFECIIVDQNPDRRVKDIVDRWKGLLNLRVIDSASGLSHARNVGLAFATGDILAFPDDDCWYNPLLLASVSNWFEQHREYGILTIGAEDHNGISSGNRWIQDRCEIRPSNAFRTTFSSTIFVRSSSAIRDGLFDESIGAGAGTRFGSGEETDYILGMLAAGVRGYFDRAWHIGHPKRDMLSGQIVESRATSYGCGMGYVLRKHSHHFLAAAFVLYDLIRSLSVLIRGDLRAASLCRSHANGIMNGYFGR